MTKDIVYKATVTTSNTNSTKHYIGMTASTFKERYRNQIKSFNHKRYSNDTELSKYIWKLKDNKQDFDITWSVLKQSISYTRGSKRCNLCLEGKLCILKEIVSTCNHRKKHLLRKSLNCQHRHKKFQTRFQFLLSDQNVSSFWSHDFTFLSFGIFGFTVSVHVLLLYYFIKICPLSSSK